MKKDNERFEQVWDGEWYDLKMRGHKEMCCDCGLVHWIDSTIVTVGGQRGIRQRAVRDTARTYAARRRMGIKIIRYK
jgi:hypothetical protein